MVLFNVEYELVTNMMVFSCRGIGTDENDIVNDLVSQVGQVRVLSIHRVSEVHRITRTIRQKLIENYLMKDTPKTKIGRPRKLDI